ncbi:MAG: hypothetical protein IJJ86_06825 [Clostridia bacterium]|nr:hypothetical protein [Clostridia bacterium]
MPRPESETPRLKMRSKRSTASLVLGVLAAAFAVLTVLSRHFRLDLRLLYAAAAATFFLAPPAICLGILGVSARVKDREKHGAPRAVFGLLLGFAAGLLAAYCLAMRMLRG